ncbi:PleD family two-component system response regulator [Beijerinckia mobilis]|uniref:PleD family two-component system response regulator n=1 Tax=Beijerinckia mobilis TaxID=231434 RepID=UPI0005520B36|nr:PleD family two-component system response regulator [Beijerinckia mobilis]
MNARILVVDDNLLNLKLLDARLSAEYFSVATATNGFDALAICNRGECDIILLDVMMPGLNGFEVCRRIKQNPSTMHIFVIMVTALDQTADRLMGLEAGADDFLHKPIDEIALIARVRSLARLHMALDELHRRTRHLALPDYETLGGLANIAQRKVILIEDRLATIEHVRSSLAGICRIECLSDPLTALSRGEEEPPDLYIVSLDLEHHDGLRLCSQLRCDETTRSIMVLALVEREDRNRLLTALDLGVNDYLTRPFDGHELIARVRTQILRKLYADHLRNIVQFSIDMALIDPLTGLYNRRFLETQSYTLHKCQGRESRDVNGRNTAVLSLMVLDIDHFKSVNDCYGHEAGDQILKYFAARMKRVVRASDYPCRIGGEEFVVLMPATRLEQAEAIAERVRLAVEKEPFVLSGTEESLHVTVSIGLAATELSDNDADNAEALFRRADKALYRAKRSGRNRVFTDAA